ncbi:hypothetical protein E2C01_042035 [Portunus trituberculatus]|uniref:Uncharacterized protein n=1 Tax=Portunus trituberculatus TaxID=210409 RepID=A0A5B7FSA7_PORTR|nr:hypothetical protein [Portunus trituberculatus]
MILRRDNDATMTLKESGGGVSLPWGVSGGTGVASRGWLDVQPLSRLKRKLREALHEVHTPLKNVTVI